MSIPSEVLDTLREQLSVHIAMGFDDAASIIENAVESCEDQADSDELTRAAAAFYRSLAAEHAERQRRWPATTDCDRLDAAFERLNEMGIMARHRWACCGSCAAAEMPGEFNRLGGEWEGVPIIGYAYYHQQDSESATQGGGLYLGYGSTEYADDERAYQAQGLRIAQTVCEVLKEHGLKVSWDGTYARRIHVSLDWQRRRRPGRFCGD